MLNPNLVVIAPSCWRRNVGLPRRGICIRAVRHVFNREDETEESVEEDGPSHLCRAAVESQRLEGGAEF